MEFFFSFFFVKSFFLCFCSMILLVAVNALKEHVSQELILTPIDIHLYLSCKVLHSIVLTDGGSYNFFFVKSCVLKLQVSIMIID